jgi:glycosyltransferase involved in cell wall biosynthesis
LAESENGGFDALAFMDADLTHAPEDLARLVEPIAGDRADFVLGSRYVPGGRMQGVPWARRFISRVGNAAVRRMLAMPVADLTSGFRAARAHVFRAISLEEHGFGIQLEGTVKAYRAGFRLAEVPITLGVRKNGYSKMAYTRSFWLGYGRLVVRLWLSRPARQTAASASPAYATRFAAKNGVAPGRSNGTTDSQANAARVVDSLARTSYAEVEDTQGRRSAV